MGNPIRLFDPDGMRVSLFDRLEDMGARHGASYEELQSKTIYEELQSKKAINNSNNKSGEWGWEPFTKNDLKEYASSLGYSNLTETGYGDLFENIFYGWMKGKHPGPVRIYEFTWNRLKMDDSKIRNTVPDFQAKGTFQGVWYSMWSIYEVKAAQDGTTINLSSYKGQTLGHIENLSTRFRSQISLIRRGLDSTLAPSLTYVTTAGVAIGADVRLRAATSGIALHHITAQYRIRSGVWQFYFGL